VSHPSEPKRETRLPMDLMLAESSDVTKYVHCAMTAPTIGTVIAFFTCRQSLNGDVKFVGECLQLLFSQAATDDHANLSAVTITKTELDSTRRRLEVTWNDGEQTSYPYIWLRDNCQCSVCFHSGAVTRRLHFHDMDMNVMPANIEVMISTMLTF